MSATPLAKKKNRHGQAARRSTRRQGSTSATCTAASSGLLSPPQTEHKEPASDQYDQVLDV
ncbi:MAG: hypothetical protein KIS75_13970, partial [Chromatiales bacterium]|nr:hypothetical protein [Chromatiales bacterium]